MVSDPNLAQSVNTLADELVVDVSLDQPASGITTNLPAVESDRIDQLFGGIGNVDVVEHDGGTLATKFQFDGDKIVAAGLGDQPSDLR